MAEEAAVASALDSITDFHEAKSLNEDKVSAAIQHFASQRGEEAQAEAQKQKDLAKVEITAEDVAVIEGELELGKAASELLLRENNGDLKAALASYVCAQ